MYCFVAFQYVFDENICNSSSTMHVFAKLKTTHVNCIIKFLVGRAGRVRAGDCWRVYSQEFFESTRVDAFPLPEIQRVPLEEVVLQVLYADDVP